MLAASDTAIAVYGAKDEEDRRTYIGGINEAFDGRNLEQPATRRISLHIGSVQNGYAGARPENVVNRVKDGGAQL
jgi:phage replication-related protein YjqB (UPF0714/DUF867 family)